MRVTRLFVEHFKPYGEGTIKLRDGVTVIHGVNGSGKSSLLEAVFFALYGSKALDGTLNDVMTNGADESTIELGFVHNGDEYEIRRELKRSGDRVSTRTCVLEGPDVSIDGARDVREFVTELLRMDAEAFVNCAYVQQGEVNKLINATPAQRQRMIDDLLQLGVLEMYRNRAGQARLGVEDVRLNAEGALEAVEEQIESKENDDPYSRLNAIESKINDVDKRIEHYETQRSEAESTRDEADTTLSAYEEQRERLESIEESIAEIESDIAETAAERETLQEKIVEAREQIGEIDDQIDEICASLDIEATDPASINNYRTDLEDKKAECESDREEATVEKTAFENQANALEEKAERLRKEAQRQETEAEQLESQAQALAEQIQEREAKRTGLIDEQETLRERFDETPVAYGEASTYLETQQSTRQELVTERAELNASIDALRSDIEEAEALREAGKCPECGQPVEESPHVDRIEEDRAELENKLEARESLEEQITTTEETIETAETLVEAESRIDEIDRTVELLDERLEEMRETQRDNQDEAATKRETVEERRSEAESIAADATQKREDAAAADERIEAIGDRLDNIDAELDRIDRVESLRDDRAAIEEQREWLHEKREALKSRNDERREWLTARRTERDELKDSVDDAAIEVARERKQKAVDYIKQVTAELESLAERRDDLTDTRGAIRADIEQLESLRDRQEALSARLDALNSLTEETTAIESLYGELRASLRQQNVDTLERMLNEIFELVYANDAYSHIELDGDYELSVFQKDGDRLDPEQLSGGERALFNLSLRCAIYRLLAEGIDGAAPTPPLILDEPTVFLDTGHVSRLVDLVAEMRGFGVSQILIVSHDDELIAAADDLVTVEKDPTTNRSTVRREPAPALSALQSADD
ncbi:DNA double-strand break repair ATPase Rad50 [Halalkalirubrum salinum]|uniref:DNA double-strand break repair ATPase Rad50 n=1 Tax=Halalkalirubrum salinum TaxID=2563889 RepID=UPI0010FB5ABE|nr:DNA double-strand break repair ATPase Rad50 [Halalkalirubrum salinum]